MKEVEKYYREGYNWIKNAIGQPELDFSNEVQNSQDLLDGIEQITVSGTE